MTLSDIVFAINRMLGWSSFLLTTRHDWVLIELEWLSEEEIVREAICCGDDRSVAFADLLVVSQHDHRQRLISEDLG
jgi:hypothetical protein